MVITSAPWKDMIGLLEWFDSPPKDQCEAAGGGQKQLVGAQPSGLASTA